MAPRPPAQCGDRVDEIDTPSLFVDLDLLKANIRGMAHFVQRKGIHLLPHAKTH
jgi:D-serine deaminase-like pyridoxal phosphate-dependent protein